MHVREHPGKITTRRTPRNAGRLLLGCLLITASFMGGTGCSRQMGPRVTDLVVPFSAEEQASWQAASNSAYRLNTGDIISIDFKFMNEMDKRNLHVLPDGTISVLGLEGVHVKGLTLAEVDSIATEAYAADIKEPDLAIVVEKIARQLIYVLGEVKMPGSYDISTGQPGIFQSISMAGGFSSGANTKEVVIARVTSEGFQYRLANLSNLNSAQTLELAMLDIRPNDVIFVPRSGLGDLRHFSQTFLSSALNVTGLFWDVWAIAHIDQVDRLYR
jgi:polysaccharide biosynthesis/export protein VpsN